MAILRIEETDLCRIAARHGTDKVGSYTRVYYELLARVRYDHLRILEIGVLNGGSLRMWREFLPNATLFAIDINPRCLKIERALSNTTIRQVDQGNATELHQFVEETGGAFDFIVDDGGHMMTQQIRSFEVLFPHVVPGGAYVIEDIGTAYWREYGGRDISQEGTSVALVKQLVDAPNLEAMMRAVGDRHVAVSPELLAHVRTDVASVSMHPSQAIIVKRHPNMW